MQRLLGMSLNISRCALFTNLTSHIKNVFIKSSLTSTRIPTVTVPAMKPVNSTEGSPIRHTALPANQLIISAMTCLEHCNMFNVDCNYGNANISSFIATGLKPLPTQWILREIDTRMHKQTVNNTQNKVAKHKVTKLLVEKVLDKRKKRIQSKKLNRQQPKTVLVSVKQWCSNNVTRSHAHRGYKNKNLNLI